MSETLITLGIIAALFAWPTVLQVVCPPCSRLLKLYRHRIFSGYTPPRNEQAT